MALPFSQVLKKHMIIEEQLENRHKNSFNLDKMSMPFHCGTFFRDHMFIFFTYI